MFGLISIQIKGQNTPQTIEMNLQYVEIKDTIFDKTIVSVVRYNDDCLFADDSYFYTIRFFQSPVTEKRSFAIVDFLKDEDIPHLRYFFTINGVKFLISNVFPEELFEITPMKRTFYWEIGQTYNYKMTFMLHFSPYYPRSVLSRVCEELNE